MKTFERGNISESLITSRFLELGYVVLMPFGGGHRYDIVVEIDGQFKRIQTKTGRIYKNKLIFNTTSNNKGYKRKSYHNEVDYLAVYCPELKKSYLIPVELTGKSAMTLQLSNPKIITKNTHIAKNFEL
jgi:hypothetical protein